MFIVSHIVDTHFPLPLLLHLLPSFIGLLASTVQWGSVGFFRSCVLKHIEASLSNVRNEFIQPSKVNYPCTAQAMFAEKFSSAHL
jgi:hypothetical protein